MKTRIDLDTTESSHKGIQGLFEKLLRKFKSFTHMALMFPVYIVAISTLGVCLVPGVSLFRFASELTAAKPALIQNLAYGLSIAFGYLAYGVCLIFVVPAINFAIRGKLKPWRGPYYSNEAVHWMLHNFLTYMVRFTFLECVTPSPLSVLFYKMMGMKVGRGAAINTTWISDPSLIELGEKVTLGGSVTLVAHYGQAGFLVISPVKIGNGCTIGLKAIIMGGVEIGDGAKVLPGSVVMPKTVIPPGETWGGVPAQRLTIAEPSAIKKIA